VPLTLPSGRSKREAGLPDAGNGRTGRGLDGFRKFFEGSMSKASRRPVTLRFCGPAVGVAEVAGGTSRFSPVP